MTKKQAFKKKITVKLFPGQAVFVADLDILDGICLTYSNIAKDISNEAEAKSLLEVVDSIKEWSTKTYYSGNGENSIEEEW